MGRRIAVKKPNVCASCGDTYAVHWAGTFRYADGKTRGGCHVPSCNCKGFKEVGDE